MQGRGRYNGSFTTERFNCPCFVVGGHSTSSTRSILCVPRLNSYFLSLCACIPPSHPVQRSLTRYHSLFLTFFSPFLALPPPFPGNNGTKRETVSLSSTVGLAFVAYTVDYRETRESERERSDGREERRGTSCGRQAEVAKGGQNTESRREQGTEKRIQMVGMNPLCGRMADNAPLYLVVGANSYRFVIDSYNECGICPFLPRSLVLSFCSRPVQACYRFGQYRRKWRPTNYEQQPLCYRPSTDALVLGCSILPRITAPSRSLLSCTSLT